MSNQDTNVNIIPDISSFKKKSTNHFSQQLNLINGKIPKLSKGSLCLHLNIRGLVNKIDLIRYLLSNNNIDVLCFNETFCDSSISDNEISIDNLRVERKDRTRHGGGLAIYISDKIFYTRRYDLESLDLEMICIQITLPFQKSMYVISIYRSPSCDVSFFEKLEARLESICSSGSSIDEILVFGDFNCDYSKLKYTRLFHKLDYLTSSYNFIQLIDIFTRVTKNSASIIDLAFTTRTSKIVEHGCIMTSLSDHYMVYVIRNLNSRQKKSLPKTVSFRSLKDFDDQEFL